MNYFPVYTYLFFGTVAKKNTTADYKFCLNRIKTVILHVVPVHSQTADQIRKAR